MYSSGEPVTRYDILDCALVTKSHKKFGLCHLLTFTTEDIIDKCISSSCVEYVLFPLFTKNKADEIVGLESVKFYWWKPGDFRCNSPRMKFLRWLRDQYKDDKTDIRELL